MRGQELKGGGAREEADGDGGGGGVPGEELVTEGS
jgi:hypothetical protein